MSSPASTPASRTSLATVEALVGQWCAQTDPARLTGAEAAEAVTRLAPLVRMLVAKQAGLGERVEGCHAHGRQAASTESWMAGLNGTSVSEAKQAIDTARRLKQCPATAEAFESGDLSMHQAAAITAAVLVDPSAEAGLVAHAADTHDLKGTRERSDRVKIAARRGEDPAVRRARLRARRRWCEFSDDGMTAVSARFVPEELVAAKPVIDAFAQAAFDRARRDGLRDSAEAYRADGILAALAAAGETIGIDLTPTRTTDTAAEVAADHLAESTETADPADGRSELDRVFAVRPDRVKWNMTILVDAIALQRGHATATETCEIVGVGPVDARWVSRILPEAMVDVLVHDLVDIKAHTTLTRHRKRAIDKALQARDRRCVVPGCHRQRRLQADHRQDFAKGGETSNANLEQLCDKHHHEKTHLGGRIERTDTEWHWYPPPPAAGEPQPPPGTIPWRAPIGEHLNPFDLTDLPEPPADSGDTLPFG